MKSIVSSLALTSILISTACGKINLTGDYDDKPLIDQAMNEANNPNNVLPYNHQLAPFHKYETVFDLLCSQQISIALEIFRDISEDYPNADTCWRYLIHAIQSNPNLCNFPVMNHWTEKTYASFLLHLLSSDRCTVEINN